MKTHSIRELPSNTFHNVPRASESVWCQQKTPVIYLNSELTKFVTRLLKVKVNLISTAGSCNRELGQMVTIRSKKLESCLPISARRDVRDVSYFPAGGEYGVSC
jgi:hypothetical protein